MALERLILARSSCHTCERQSVAVLSVPFWLDRRATRARDSGVIPERAILASRIVWDDDPVILITEHSVLWRSKSGSKSTLRASQKLVPASIIENRKPNRSRYLKWPNKHEIELLKNQKKKLLKIDAQSFPEPDFDI